MCESGMKSAFEVVDGKSSAFFFVINPATIQLMG